MDLFKNKRYIKSCIGRLFKKVISKGLFSNLKIILMYHRLSEDLKYELYDHAMYVKAETFSSHINEIKKYMDIVNLENIVYNKDNNKRLCAITFDDGWIDNYNFAYPILKNTNTPATIFVCSNMIGTNKKFWFDSLNELLNMALKLNMERGIIEYFSTVVPLKHVKNLDQSLLFEICLQLKKLAPDKIETIINDGYNKLNIKNQDDRHILNWNEINEMCDGGISFGSHGLDHEILTKLKFEEQRKAIEQSYKTLRIRTKKFVPFFAYPNGDWNKNSLKLLLSTGYSGAVTTKLGTTNFYQSRFLLKRIAIHEDISDTSELLWFRIFQAVTANQKNVR